MYVQKHCLNTQSLAHCSIECCNADAPYEPGYEGFVELSKQIMSGRNSKQQQRAVLSVLDALMPPNAPTTFRTLFPFKQVYLYILCSCASRVDVPALLQSTDIA